MNKQSPAGLAYAGDIQSVELARSVSDLLRLVYERKNIIEKLDTSMALLQRHAEVGDSYNHSRQRALDCLRVLTSSGCKNAR